MMTFSEFKDSLPDRQPPPDVNELLRALWHDAKGDWNAAHQIAQDVSSREGAWVHAYLHRKEGDRSNAMYWYGRAKQEIPTTSLEQEWEEMVREFLGNGDR